MTDVTHTPLVFEHLIIAALYAASFVPVIAGVV